MASILPLGGRVVHAAAVGALRSRGRNSASPRRATATRVPAHGGPARRRSGPRPLPGAGRRLRAHRGHRPARWCPRAWPGRSATPCGCRWPPAAASSRPPGGPRRIVSGGPGGAGRPGRRRARRRRPRPEHDHADLRAWPAPWPAPGSPATRSWSAGSTTTPTSAPGCSWPRTAGALVRWAEVDIETGELPAWQYDELLTGRTRLVAVTAASNAIGTCPDVGAIAARAHAVGALVYVDAAHLAAAPVRRPGGAGRGLPGAVGRTSGAARTSAPWSPSRPCSPSCGPDKLAAGAGPRARPLRAGHAAGRAAGRRRRRRWSTSPRCAATRPATPARAAGRVRWPRSSPTSARCSSGWTRRCASMRHVQVHRLRRGSRCPTLSFTVARMRPRAGRRGALPPRDLRLGRRRLRARAVRRARRQRAGRRGAARAAALQHRRGGRLRDRRRRRPARLSEQRRTGD